MNTSTEHMPLCNESEPLADASRRIVDLMKENGYCLAVCLSAAKTFSSENRLMHLDIRRNVG